MQRLFNDGDLVGGDLGFVATYSTNFLHDREEMPAGNAALMAATVAGPRLATIAAWRQVRAFSHLVNSVISYTNLANAGAEEGAVDRCWFAGHSNSRA